MFDFERIDLCFVEKNISIGGEKTSEKAFHQIYQTNSAEYQMNG